MATGDLCVKPGQTVDDLAVNTIRVLAADMVQSAGVGHPGMPMGMAPAGHVLFTQHLTFNPDDYKWPNRDRFVLSNGHGCALQYALLHLSGYDLTVDDLKGFRQLDSKTPGHPESHITHGVEVTTGPLGQGIGNAVGLAWAQAHMAGRYNKPGFDLFTNYTFVFAGDGCMQEGIASEAASLAGHWKLGKLILIYDDNHVSIDGDTQLSFTEDVMTRYESYGWQRLTVELGDHDLYSIKHAIKEAKSCVDKPTIIQLKTTIGFGSKKQGTADVHGAALGADEVKAVKKVFGFNPDESYAIKNEVYDLYKEAANRGRAVYKKWEESLKKYGESYPELAKELQNRIDGKVDYAAIKSKLPKFKHSDKADATRNISGVVLNILVDNIPQLVGGSADLTPSNKTALKKEQDFQYYRPAGRYIHFGIREHGMFAIGNGISAYGTFIPFTATFLNFLEYGFPAFRLTALSQVQQIAILTHDSIGLGEDGPTHQPIEILALTRATPGMLTFRPADGNEVVGSYIGALQYTHGPSLLSLARQNTPQLEGSDAEKTLKGGYILQEPQNGKKTNLIIVATGSEVSIAVDAAAILAKEEFAVRVVSMPCTSLFDQQPVDYRRSVITPGVFTVSIEALGQFGWERYSHASLGLLTFGASGKPDDVYKKFGLTPPQVAGRIKERNKQFTKDQEALGDKVAPLPTHLSFFHINDVGSHVSDAKGAPPQHH